MIGVVAWLSVAFAVGILVVRRRSVAIGLMACQSLGISFAALAAASDRSLQFGIATGVLMTKSVLLAALLGATVIRTRETSPVRARWDPMLRLGVGLATVLAVSMLVPAVPTLPGPGRQASASLIAAGIAIVALRRATILQLVGILVAENGLALAAVSVSGGLPAVIDLGAGFDLVLVVSVAVAFHTRIHALLGSGDASLQKELRD